MVKHKNDVKRDEIFQYHQSTQCSLKRSRKHDRQLGNHSLFTVGLRGEEDIREEGAERGGEGVKWELSARPIAGGQGRF